MFYVEGTRKLQPQSEAVSKTTSVQVCVINPSFCTKNSVISRKTVGEKKFLIENAVLESTLEFPRAYRYIFS